MSVVDSHGFGILIFETFNGGSINSDQIGQTKNIPPSMHQSYKRLLNPNPKARLSVAHFRDQGRRSGGFFETPLIKLSEGLEHLGLKSNNERDEFLRYRQRIAFSELAHANCVLASSMKSPTTSQKNTLAPKSYQSYSNQWNSGGVAQGSYRPL